MDPELQKKIDAARAEGYTDEEIQAYLQGQQTTQPEVGPPQSEVAPYQGMDRSEEYKGLAQGMGAEGLRNLLQLAGVGAGVYGAKKLVDQYMGARQAPAAPPAAPPAPTTGSPQAPFGTETEAQRKFSQRFSQPPKGGLIDKTTQMVRQLAANKVLQNAARVGAGGLALMGGGVAFAGQPGNLGPPVPQSGQYRGMEINPNTGRPWTRQELEALR